mmetsp:Transcript_22738/g.71979  ORF Transcript_22738/g.71979 Transcript_22738/m.71979 type:complete len:374 (+) Transcript_22738:905-2026(+)
MALLYARMPGTIDCRRIPARAAKACGHRCPFSHAMTRQFCEMVSGAMCSSRVWASSTSGLDHCRPLAQALSTALQVTKSDAGPPRLVATRVAPRACSHLLPRSQAVTAVLQMMTSACRPASCCASAQSRSPRCPCCALPTAPIVALYVGASDCMPWPRNSPARAHACSQCWPWPQAPIAELQAATSSANPQSRTSANRPNEELHCPLRSQAPRAAPNVPRFGERPLRRALARMARAPLHMRLCPSAVTRMVYSRTLLRPISSSAATFSVILSSEQCLQFPRSHSSSAALSACTGALMHRTCTLAPGQLWGVQSTGPRPLSNCCWQGTRPRRSCEPARRAEVAVPCSWDWSMAARAGGPTSARCSRGLRPRGPA